MDVRNRIAKVAGAGYLAIFVSGIFANFFVLESMLVAGDATATASNILNNEGQFRLGILSFVVMVVFDVVLTWALYELLKTVNRNVSLLAAWFRLVNCALFGVALYNLFGVLHVLGNSPYLAALSAGQLNAQVMLFLHAFQSTWLVGLIFFGIHLILLGYLVFKSSDFPRFIGVLLMIAAVGYLIDSFANFLLPSYEDYKSIFMMIVVIPGVVGELSLTFWLLFKGVKTETELKASA
jgi:hypothetical protein